MGQPGVAGGGLEERVLGSVLRKLGIRRAAVPSSRAKAGKPARPRDFQRGRVYRWEGEHVLPHDREILSLDACARLVEVAYRWAEADGAAAAGWRPPGVHDGRGRRHACGSRQAIKLPRWARTRPVVLHECAHGMADDQHGPRFVARYVALLERFLGLDRAMLHASLAHHRVRIAIADGLLPRPHRTPANTPQSSADMRRIDRTRLKRPPDETS